MRVYLKKLLKFLNNKADNCFVLFSCRSIQENKVYDYLRECAIPQTKNGEIYYNSKYYKYARWAFKNKKVNRDKNAELKETNNVPCFDDTNVERYFNREDVQKALHVTAKRDWAFCSDEVGDRYEIQDKGSI